MFQGLKIAFKRQRKLLVIFFIAIFLPSVSLSIFGIIALRNEKFRIEKQIENEQSRIANSIKDRIETKLTDIGKKLENLAGYQAFSEKDYPVIKDLAYRMFEKDSLTNQVFLLFENEEPFYPLFQNGIGEEEVISAVTYNKYQQEQIKEAEKAEYTQNDYISAASIYNLVYLQSKNKTIKARMLNQSARNLMKAGKFREAGDVYSKITEDYPKERAESGLPLDLYAKLEKTDCFKMLGENEYALNNDLNIFKELVLNKWNLNESQYKTYASMVIDRLKGFFSDNSVGSADNLSRFEILKKQYQQKTEQWETIRNINSYIIPELGIYLQSDPSLSSKFEFSKKVGNNDYLILGISIPAQNLPHNKGLLATKLNNSYLQNNILNNAVEEIGLPRNTALYISSLAGDSIRGIKNNIPGAITTTSLFDDNFPPWRLEVIYTGPRGLGETSIFSNFYFWTITTLIVILVFGAVLITRFVAREIEVLKIKSDFVSSVSHEFKTPLTSMKALTERLERGKVTEPAKIKQYVSIISHDIERLIHLVGNVLSFSKIEEGKKTYKKEETDIGVWLKDVINNYRKEIIESDITINIKVANDLPVIYIDKDSLSQAIFNLLDNAAKFSLADKLAEVTAERKNNSIIIKIKDKGIGIEKGEKDKIFEKFYRGESAVKYLIKGTGLGLALVKYSVEAHDGRIDVGSETGWSTVFTITLPAG